MAAILGVVAEALGAGPDTGRNVFIIDSITINNQYPVGAEAPPSFRAGDQNPQQQMPTRRMLPANPPASRQQDANPGAEQTVTAQQPRQRTARPAQAQTVRSNRDNTTRNGAGNLNLRAARAPRSAPPSNNGIVMFEPGNLSHSTS
jgi:hypothetical protein